MIGIHFTRAHRKLVGIDPIADAPCARAVGPHAPGVLVDFGPIQRASVGIRGKILHVPFEFAYQIRTRRPDRHHQISFIRHIQVGRDFDAHLNFQEMRPRLGHRNCERNT